MSLSLSPLSHTQPPPVSRGSTTQPAGRPNKRPCWGRSSPEKGRELESSLSGRQTGRRRVTHNCLLSSQSLPTVTTIAFTSKQTKFLLYHPLRVEYSTKSLSEHTRCVQDRKAGVKLDTLGWLGWLALECCQVSANRGCLHTAVGRGGRPSWVRGALA